MKNLFVLTFTLLSVSVASAAYLPCTISGIPYVTAGAGGTSPDFTCGTLTFDNFQLVNPTGGAVGRVDILSAQYSTVTGEVDVQLNPNLLAAQDEQLLFQVWGGITQIDMSVGGQNAAVTELACVNPIATTGPLAFLCTDPTGTASVNPLGQITVASATGSQPVFSSAFNSSSPVYIFKDIETGNGGALTGFTESFEVAPVPEPVSLVPLSGLLALGFLRRRAARTS